MLVLKRKEGQWIEIKHRSGDLIRIRVYNIRPRLPGQLDLAFDDDALNFEVDRPERRQGVREERRCEEREPSPLRPLAHCLSRRVPDPSRSVRSS